MNTIPLICSILGGLLFAGAAALDYSTRRTRGPGSWAEDRIRLKVAGAMITLSIICYGVAVANLIAP